MIAYLKGKISEIGENHVVLLSQGGVGYKVLISSKSMFYEEIVKKPDCEIEIFTSQYFRENDSGLVGFKTSSERNFYELLITVSGVGPKIASAILGRIPYRDLASMIMNDDISGIVTVPGIGKKTAERMILELRDKVLDRGDIKPSTKKSYSKQESDDVMYLSMALSKLGFTNNEIKEMLKVGEGLISEGLDIEQVLRKILQSKSS
ncbi:Holliday junction branch migration protein RuvA [Candidatus Dojkabacteria bacterium]|nr:Holliday junction branch migration protein RuvA [Candidatus Dojkabacteria bacterium]